MAATDGSACYSDPNFAVICSFLEKYGELLGLPEISFVDLQQYLEDTKSVSRQLVDLHVRLLKRIGKTNVNHERFERSIAKFCFYFSDHDGWEVERFGYRHAQLSTKLRVLKNLLESQFDYNVKFKEKINEFQPEEMRFLPAGRDRDGMTYWYFLDKDLNVHIYREEPDDENAESWKLICSDRDQLALLLDRLRNNTQRKFGEEDKEENQDDKSSLFTDESKTTSKEGSPDREEKAADVSTVLVKKESDHVKHEPPGNAPVLPSVTTGQSADSVEKGNQKTVETETAPLTVKVKVECVTQEESSEQTKDTEGTQRSRKFAQNKSCGKDKSKAKTVKSKEKVSLDAGKGRALSNSDKTSEHSQNFAPDTGQAVDVTCKNSTDVHVLTVGNQSHVVETGVLEKLEIDQCENNAVSESTETKLDKSRKLKDKASKNMAKTSTENDNSTEIGENCDREKKRTKEQSPDGQSTVRNKSNISHSEYVCQERDSSDVVQGIEGSSEPKRRTKLESVEKSLTDHSEATDNLSSNETVVKTSAAISVANSVVTKSKDCEDSDKVEEQKCSGKPLLETVSEPVKHGTESASAVKASSSEKPIKKCIETVSCAKSDSSDSVVQTQSSLDESESVTNTKNIDNQKIENLTGKTDISRLVQQSSNKNEIEETASQKQSTDTEKLACGKEPESDRQDIVKVAVKGVKTGVKDQEKFSVEPVQEEVSMTTDSAINNDQEKSSAKEIDPTELEKQFSSKKDDKEKLSKDSLKSSTIDFEEKQKRKIDAHDTNISDENKAKEHHKEGTSHQREGSEKMNTEETEIPAEQIGSCNEKDEAKKESSEASKTCGDKGKVEKTEDLDDEAGDSSAMMSNEQKGTMEEKGENKMMTASGEKGASPPSFSCVPDSEKLTAVENKGTEGNKTTKSIVNVSENVPEKKETLNESVGTKNNLLVQKSEDSSGGSSKEIQSVSNESSVGDKTSIGDSSLQGSIAAAKTSLPNSSSKSSQKICSVLSEQSVVLDTEMLETKAEAIAETDELDKPELVAETGKVDKTEMVSDKQKLKLKKLETSSQKAEKSDAMSDQVTQDSTDAVSPESLKTNNEASGVGVVTSKVEANVEKTAADAAETTRKNKTVSDDTSKTTDQFPDTDESSWREEQLDSEKSKKTGKQLDSGKSNKAGEQVDADKTSKTGEQLDTEKTSKTEQLDTDKNGKTGEQVDTDKTSKTGEQLDTEKTSKTEQLDTDKTGKTGEQLDTDKTSKTEQLDTDKTSKTGEQLDTDKTNKTGEQLDPDKTSKTGEQLDADKTSKTGEQLDTDKTSKTGEQLDTDKTSTTGEQLDTDKSKEAEEGLEGKKERVEKKTRGTRSVRARRGKKAGKTETVKASVINDDKMDVTESQSQDKESKASDKTDSNSLSEGLVNGHGDMTEELVKETIEQSVTKDSRPGRGRGRGGSRGRGRGGRGGSRIAKRTASQADNEVSAKLEPAEKRAKRGGGVKRGSASSRSRKAGRPAAENDVESSSDSNTPLANSRGRGRNVAGRGGSAKKPGGKKKKMTEEENENSSSSDDLPLSKAAKKKKIVGEDSSDFEPDEPIAPNKKDPVKKTPKSAPKAQKSKPVSSQPEKEDISAALCTRRSLRIQTMKKKEPDLDFEITSDGVPSEEVSSEVDLPSEDTDDDDFKPHQGRNRRRQAALIKKEEERVPMDDTPCLVCNKCTHPDMMLLCDSCDKGYHMACLRPPLMAVPEGDWFCPPCEHAKLINKLAEYLHDLDTNCKKKDRLVRRKERLAFVGISLDNILKEEKRPPPQVKQEYSDERDDEEDMEEEEGSSAEEDNRDDDYVRPRHRRLKRSRRAVERSGHRSSHSRKRRERQHTDEENNLPDEVFAKRTCRTRSAVSYQFKEYDDLIRSAIEEDLNDPKPARPSRPPGRSRGKDLSNLPGMKKEQEQEVKEEEMESVDEEGEKGMGKDMSNILGSKSDEDDEKEKTKKKGKSRGKDMSNILGMDSDEEKEMRRRQKEEEMAAAAEHDGRPPPVVKKKSKRRLTMLDSDDNQEEDDSEEFHISESDEDSEASAEASQEEDDLTEEDSGDWRPQRTWFNRAASRRSSRRGGRRNRSSRENFVVDDDYDSDELASKRRSTRNSARRRVRYRDWESDSEETELETEESETSLSEVSSDDSAYKRKRNNKKKSRRRFASETESSGSEYMVKSKRGKRRRVATSESDGDDESVKDKSRPSAKAKKQSKLSVLSKSGSNKEQASEDDSATEVEGEAENVPKRKKNVLRDSSTEDEAEKPEAKEDYGEDEDTEVEGDSSPPEQVPQKTPDAAVNNESKPTVRLEKLTAGSKEKMQVASVNQEGPAMASQALPSSDVKSDVAVVLSPQLKKPRAQGKGKGKGKKIQESQEEVIPSEEEKPERMECGTDMQDNIPRADSVPSATVPTGSAPPNFLNVGDSSRRLAPEAENTPQGQMVPPFPGHRGVGPPGDMQFQRSDAGPVRPQLEGPFQSHYGRYPGSMGPPRAPGMGYPPFPHGPYPMPGEGFRPSQPETIHHSGSGENFYRPQAVAPFGPPGSEGFRAHGPSAQGHGDGFKPGLGPEGLRYPYNPSGPDGFQPRGSVQGFQLPGQRPGFPAVSSQDSSKPTSSGHESHQPPGPGTKGFLQPRQSLEGLQSPNQETYRSHLALQKDKFSTAGREQSYHPPVSGQERMGMRGHGQDGVQSSPSHDSFRSPVRVQSFQAPGSCPDNFHVSGAGQESMRPPTTHQDSRSPSHKEFRSPGHENFRPQVPGHESFRPQSPGHDHYRQASPKHSFRLHSPEGIRPQGPGHEIVRPSVPGHEGVRPPISGHENFRPAGLGHEGFRPPGHDVIRPADPRQEGFRPPGPGHEGFRSPGHGHESFRPPGPGQEFRPPVPAHEGFRPPAPGYEGLRPPGHGHECFRPFGPGHEGFRPSGPSPEGTRHPRPAHEAFRPPVTGHEVFRPPGLGPESFRPPAQEGFGPVAAGREGFKPQGAGQEGFRPQGPGLGMPGTSPVHEDSRVRPLEGIKQPGSNESSQPASETNQSTGQPSAQHMKESFRPPLPDVPSSSPSRDGSHLRGPAPGFSFPGPRFETFRPTGHGYWPQGQGFPPPGAGQSFWPPGHNVPHPGQRPVFNTSGHGEGIQYSDHIHRGFNPNFRPSGLSEHFQTGLRPPVPGQEGFRPPGPVGPEQVKNLSAQTLSETKKPAQPEPIAGTEVKPAHDGESQACPKTEMPSDQQQPADKDKGEGKSHNSENNSDKIKVTLNPDSSTSNRPEHPSGPKGSETEVQDQFEQNKISKDHGASEHLEKSKSSVSSNPDRVPHQEPSKDGDGSQSQDAPENDLQCKPGSHLAGGDSMDRPSTNEKEKDEKEKDGKPVSSEQEQKQQDEYLSKKEQTVPQIQPRKCEESKPEVFSPQSERPTKTLGPEESQPVVPSKQGEDISHEQAPAPGETLQPEKSSGDGAAECMPQGQHREEPIPQLQSRQAESVLHQTTHPESDRPNIPVDQSLGPSQSVEEKRAQVPSKQEGVKSPNKGEGCMPQGSTGHDEKKDQSSSASGDKGPAQAPSGLGEHYKPAGQPGETFRPPFPGQGEGFRPAFSPERFPFHGPEGFHPHRQENFHPRGSYPPFQGHPYYSSPAGQPLQGLPPPGFGVYPPHQFPGGQRMFGPGLNPYQPMMPPVSQIPGGPAPGRGGFMIDNLLRSKSGEFPPTHMQTSTNASSSQMTPPNATPPPYGTPPHGNPSVTAPAQSTPPGSTPPQQPQIQPLQTVRQKTLSSVKEKATRSPKSPSQDNESDDKDVSEIMSYVMNDEFFKQQTSS